MSNFVQRVQLTNKLFLASGVFQFYNITCYEIYIPYVSRFVNKHLKRLFRRACSVKQCLRVFYNNCIYIK